MWRCKRERQEENGLDRQEKTRSELIQVEEIIRVMADSHGDVSNYGNTTSSFPCLLLFKLLRFSRMWWLPLFGSFCTFCRTMAFARPSLSFTMSICTTSMFWTKERTRRNIWNFFKDSGELRNKSIWWQKRNQKNNKDELFFFVHWPFLVCLIAGRSFWMKWKALERLLWLQPTKWVASF